MNSKGAVVATPTQVYEDFVPSSKLVLDEHSDTIHLNLSGFKKEQLRVILTSTGILKISGQRPIGQNKWQRFQKEFPVSENCDKSKISAKFENGILHVKQPKLMITSEDKELAAKGAENTPPAPKRQKTSSLRDEFSKEDKADINTPAKEEPKNNSEQTEAKRHAEKKLPADENSSSSSSDSASESESTDDDTDDETTGKASCFVSNLKKPREVMGMTLVALLALGISVYFANVMESSHQ